MSDDNIIYKWDSNSTTATKFLELDKFATDLDWLHMAKGIYDLFAIGFVDGSFKLITKLSKIDKVVSEAHQGAVSSS